jgi:hypothetical protein
VQKAVLLLLHKPIAKGNKGPSFEKDVNVDVKKAAAYRGHYL